MSTDRLTPEHEATLLAEIDRLRAERDAYCDRVDTLTAVAKGNKRHVSELQKALAERDELRDALNAKDAQFGEALSNSEREIAYQRSERDRLLAVLERTQNKVADLTAKPTEPVDEGPSELTIYRASHDSIVMGLYTTRQAAYEHCEAHELRDDPVSPMAWNIDEDGVADLVRLRIPRSPGAESATGYVVTPLTVASEYDEEADE